MPEMSIDGASANRFISSLSKSLQALCHGCMDFDSGIEIMGYININIDSGNKVDYVLNEKVSKSTTNSMTFISNSFLAKKEQQKHRQDGSCSPIPELQDQTGSHQQYSSYPYHHQSAYPHHTSALPHSSYSRSLRGVKKRSWAGADRDRNASPQKHARGGASKYAHHPNYRSSSGFQSQQNSGASSSIDPSYSQSRVPVSSNNYADNLHIKKELNSFEDSNVGEHSATDPAQCSESESVANSNIKSEPSAVHESEEKTSSGPSLDPNSELPPSDVPGNSETYEQPQGDLSFPNFESLPLSFQGDDVPKPTDSTDEGDNTGHMGEMSEEAVEYDESQEMYPGTSSVDQGDASGDGQQFDVIEIGDEEEDPSMYGDAQLQLGNLGLNYNKPGTSHKTGLKRQSPVGSNMWSSPGGLGDLFLGSELHGEAYMSLAGQGHAMMPFACQVCGQGYTNPSGLQKHMARKHTGQRFVCPICDKEFNDKFVWKRHMKTLHNYGQCPHCAQVFQLGNDYYKHVYNCSGS